MSFFAIGTAVVAVGATVYGAVEANSADQNAADVDNATAAYNNKYDTAIAQQLDLDTLQNVDTERQDDAVYLSRQAASYASAGVLATSGSPLHAQITNAGRFEQQIQQKYVNSQQQQQMYYSQGKVGIAAGAAQADADRQSGTLALVNGGAKIAGMGYQDYKSGVFNTSAASD